MAPSAPALTTPAQAMYDDTMWYLQALGAALGLTLLADLKASRKIRRLRASADDQDSGRGQWREHHDRLAHRLWLDCLLYAQLTRSAERPNIGLLTLAEAGYAAAWAALSVWHPEDHHQQRLHTTMASNAAFLQAIKSDDEPSLVADLRDRLAGVKSQGEGRLVVWAWVIGDSLRRFSGMTDPAPYQEVTELGWPMASFGLSFWTREQVQYRRGCRLYNLNQPFDSRDAFELLGPFSKPQPRSLRAKLERVTFASTQAGKGLRSPQIWDHEAFLGGLPGVGLTRLGYVHRQFAGDGLAEWFPAIEVHFDDHKRGYEELLQQYWEHFGKPTDLLFYHRKEHEKRAQKAWREWSGQQESWSVAERLALQPAAWFDVAESKYQKARLREFKSLGSLFEEEELATSLLATKLNAFAAGFANDQDVVMVAARWGLDDRLTYALRMLRHFGKAC